MDMNTIAKLADRFGNRFRIAAIVEGFTHERGWNGHDDEIVTLTDVRDFATDTLLMEELSLKAGLWADDLNLGDYIAFTARVWRFEGRAGIFRPPTVYWDVQRPTAVKVIEPGSREGGAPRRKIRTEPSALLARLAGVPIEELTDRFEEWRDLFRPLAWQRDIPVVTVTETYRVLMSFCGDRDDATEAEAFAVLCDLARVYGIPNPEMSGLLEDLVAMHDEGRDALPPPREALTGSSRRFFGLGREAPSGPPQRVLITRPQR
jgi:hypothetical protein